MNPSRRARAAVAALALALAAVLAGCESAPVPRSAPPRAGTAPAAAFRPAGLEALDRAVAARVARGELPGAVLWLEHRGQAHAAVAGARAVEPAREAMTGDTVFDAASLTKVLATTPCILRLAEAGRLRLDDPVARHIPAFAAHGKQAITIRQLLTHTSGLRSGLPSRGAWSGPGDALAIACALEAERPPGTSFVYSDVNFIVLGELVRQLAGMGVDRAAHEWFYAPLGMRDTGYRPLASGMPSSGMPSPGMPSSRIAPTERQKDGTCLRGVVHDPTARRMGGVSGHAGLFTTAPDLARFCRMLLRGGELDGRRVLAESTVRAMTAIQTPPGIPARGLGWDIDSPYAGPRGDHFPVGSYGHTGWTGTSLWIDPGSDTFVVLLSNRNHPTEDGDVRGLRREVGTLAAEALADVAWPRRVAAAAAATATGDPGTGAAGPTDAAVPASAGVLQGIDVLERDGFAPLRGKRVGLVTNHTGRDRARRATIDLLFRAPDVRLVALFSPEHGIRGVQDEKVSDGKDEATGLPVYSLYGERRAPEPAQLAGLDVLVFDIQDVGCRFYTYISTLGNCLEAAAKAGVPFLVLDRVNPVNGVDAEGPVLTGPRSFVAWHEIPLRHGMTAGELARMFDAERRLGARLSVVRCEGWRRGDWFDATGLPWTNPSPNMRGLTAATLYPGVGLLEFCNVSVGRGTGTPFEVIGAPWADDRVLAADLNAAGLAGIRFVPVRFTPASSVHQGKECGGVQMIVTDRGAFRAADLGVALASALHRRWPSELNLGKMAALLGDGPTLEAIRAGRTAAEIRATRDRGMAAFRARRAAFLLY